MAQDQIFGAENNLNSGGTGGPVTTTGLSGADAGKRLLDVHVLKDSTGSEANTTVVIANEDIIAANTEQSYALPTNTKKFILRNRGNSDIRLAFNSGETVSGNYLTLKGTAVYWDDNFYASQSIYFQSPNADDVIEIVAYT